MFITSAAKPRYLHDDQRRRARGTPESNPLYDAFPTDLLLAIRPNPSATTPLITESPYDRPRTDQDEAKPRKNKKDSGRNSEIDLLMDTLGGETGPTCNADLSNKRKKKRRQHILNNLFDFLAIVFTCVIFGLIYLFIPPNQRGFFCDDTSIQYPFRPDTIPMWLLAIYGGVVPIIIFCIVELWVTRPFNCRRGSGEEAVKQRRIDYFKTIFHTVFLFVLGITVCFLITEVGKRTIGRLRPYYLTVCNPIWTNINCTRTVPTASGSVVIPQYITDHHCNTTATDVELREAKLSFPSGHSSYATYAFIFLFVYFEARLVCPNIQFLKPFLQCLCVATAFFTCLSRVTDYKHHATDVIGGSLIGFCIAIFTAVRVGTYLWKFSVYCETEEETKKDRLPKEERIKVPGVETKPSGELRSINPSEENYTRARPTNNRSNYDNVSTNPTAQRTISPSSGRTADVQRVSPGRTTFEEANV